MIRNWAAIVVLSISMTGVPIGCGTVPLRNPLPEQYGDAAEIPGIPRARFWGDDAPSFYKEIAGQPRDELMQQFPAVFGCEHHYLALSGGGPDGAFGAGLLVGWSAAGTRPQFTIVTGTSTGAIIAPFAFLGPAYDARLEEMYTRYSTKDLVVKRNIFNTLTGSSVADTAPMKKMLAAYLDRDAMQAIADEHQKGRRLYVATTHIDAMRPVIWNVGLIAASGRPEALELIHKTILASAAIPAIFPPVLFEVEADGVRYDEMHVDGGAASQVFLYPAELDWKYLLKHLEVKGRPKVYVVRNSRLTPDWETVYPRILSIAGVSIQSLIRTQGIGDLYRIFLDCRRDGIDFHLACVPGDFDLKPKEDFDPVYMGKLFDLGYQAAQDGYPWDRAPPGFE